VSTDTDARVALVTGASRGIGQAVAVVLAEAGWDVVVNFQGDAAAAGETARRVEQAGRRTLAVQADVADAAQSQALVDGALAAFGRIDLLVNNAGIAANAPLALMPAADIERIVRTNLVGVMRMTQLVVPAMVRQGGGRIVNVSSSGASKPGLGQAAYAAAKGGVEAFTRAAAVELAGAGVLVNAVAPGVTVTEMSAPMREHRHDEVMRRLLVKRYAEPEEVARAVAYLAGPACRWMVGQTLHLDGGMKMA